MRALLRELLVACAPVIAVQVGEYVRQRQAEAAELRRIEFEARLNAAIDAEHHEDEDHV